MPSSILTDDNQSTLGQPDQEVEEEQVHIYFLLFICLIKALIFLHSSYSIQK